MVGVYFGSFDPPHIGHTLMITTALQCGRYEKVIVVPAWENPWKAGQTKYATRRGLLLDLYGGIPGIEVSDIEREMNIKYGSTKTYSVIQELKKTYPSLEIITTPETLVEIPGWWNGDKVLEGNMFNVLMPLHLTKNKKSKYIQISKELEGRLCSKSIPSLDVSSTSIRQMIKDGIVPLPWIDSGTYRKIKLLGLYQNG